MLTSDYRKGEIPRPAQSGVEDLDDDLDSKIDSAIKQVWEYYDKKGEGKGRENSGRWEISQWTTINRSYK